MRKRRTLYFAFLLIFLLALAMLLTDSSPKQIVELSDEQRTLTSFKKVDEFPLYVMTYYGDYGFDDYLKRGMTTAQRSPWLTELAWACTTFSTSNPEEDFFLGRNFDWYDHPALLLFTDPPQAYASVAMVDLHYLGFLREQEPTSTIMDELFDAPYWPFDGMNEHGLAVGMMAVSDADSGRDPEKVTISSLGVIRLMLDYAKDVNEAIALLGQYNIDFTGGPPVHYLIADGAGNSVVIEFVDGEMILLRGEDPWQVSTNFIISTEKPQGADSSCRRYNQAYQDLQDAEGIISSEGAMAVLESVAQPITIWSIVYNRTSGEISVVAGRQYDKVNHFKLEMAD